MAMPKRKPSYDGKKNMEELMMEVCAYYGEPVDDRLKTAGDHVSLRDVANHFNITVMKARKVLITAGLYSTMTSRRIQKLHEEGMTVAEITETTGLKRSSVNSYLPFSHTIYKLPEISIKAERQKQYRVRVRNRERSETEIEDKLWNEFIYLQGCLFTACNGLDFTYKIKGERLYVGRNKKSISRDNVMRAFRNIQAMDYIVHRPKQLGVFGSSYLFPVFLKMGIIKPAATEKQ